MLPRRRASPMLEPLTSPQFTGAVRHGFFTRQGGVSEGLYASLNVGLGSEDEAGAVQENRKRCVAWLGAQRLVSPYQVHGAEVVTVAAEAPVRAATADALVSREPGLALGILTADCVPVLFADPGAAVIGAAHAGWRGAAAGVLANTIAAMERLGATRAGIRAAIGPAIAQASYQVGGEVRDGFIAREADLSRVFTPDSESGKYRFDLPGAVAALLAKQGLHRIDWIARDTYAEERLFFSYRRATHRAEPDYGRQLSAIALSP